MHIIDMHWYRPSAVTHSLRELAKGDEVVIICFKPSSSNDVAVPTVFPSPSTIENRTSLTGKAGSGGHSFGSVAWHAHFNVSHTSSMTPR